MEEEVFCFTSEMATHRLILLHGWGADARDLLSLGRELIGPLKKNIELVSLNAPHIHPLGEGKQWYELFPANWDEAYQAANNLKIRLIKLASVRIPLDKTALLGFSQGGAMAINVGVELPLAGLVGCSAYPHPGFIPSKIQSPIYLTHGKQDNVVPLNESEKLYELLNRNDNSVQFNVFEGGHEIPQEIYKGIQLFLNQMLL